METCNNCGRHYIAGGEPGLCILCSPGETPAEDPAAAETETCPHCGGSLAPIGADPDETDPDETDPETGPKTEPETATPTAPEIVPAGVHDDAGEELPEE